MIGIKVTIKRDVCKYGNPLSEFDPINGSTLSHHYCDGCYFDAKAENEKKQQQDAALEGKS